MSEEIIELRKTRSIVGCQRGGYSVVVQGREVPNMRCYERGDYIEIILDNRFSYTFHKDVAYDAADFAAQAMAIGMGYAHMGAASKDMPFAAEVMIMDTGEPEK